jgi:hypothetical protein
MSSRQDSTVLWANPFPWLAAFWMSWQHDITKTAARAWLETILEGARTPSCLGLHRHFVSFLTKLVAFGKVPFAVD